VEKHVIQFFVHAAAALGLPKSIGELFGLLYCSESPLSFEQIVGLLGISKGSASQGLRFLQGISAVHVSYLARDRRSCYHAEPSLRRIISGLLRSKIGPHLATADQRFRGIQEMLATQQNDPGLSRRNGFTIRIEALQTWHRAAREFPPHFAQIAAPLASSDDTRS
jgi:DNA-binding transcriptional regulator GbsR (MarR family)